MVEHLGISESIDMNYTVEVNLHLKNPFVAVKNISTGEKISENETIILVLNAEENGNHEIEFSSKSIT